MHMVAELLVFSIDPRQYIMSTTEELLARFGESRERSRAGKTTTRFRVEQALAAVSIRRQCTYPVNWSHRHAHTGQAEDVRLSASGMDNLAIHDQGVCVCDARKNCRRVRVSDSDLVINSDMTVELQSLSTQLCLMLSDQALEIVRNSLEGVGAKVRRKLLWQYEPGVGHRYGAMLQSLLERRFGGHDETDLARVSFERDKNKYERQSSDLISDAIKHGIVCGGVAHQGLKQHIDLSVSRLSTYKSLRDEIINHSRARRTLTDPYAVQVHSVRQS